MTEFGHGPAWLTSISIWGYWSGVMYMAGRVRLQGAGTAGLIPSQPVERLMWIVWVPVIAGWVLFPWFSISQSDPVWQIPEAAATHLPWLTLRWFASFVVFASLLATVFCWRWMGQNWRVGVDTGTRTELITDGPFRRVRHPIYTLSMVMMSASLLAVPSLPMLIIALIHVILMNIKARNEETWMERQYGAKYRAYRGRAGRFLPRFRS